MANFPAKHEFCYHSRAKANQATTTKIAAQTADPGFVPEHVLALELVLPCGMPSAQVHSHPEDCFLSTGARA